MDCTPEKCRTVYFTNNSININYTVYCINPRNWGKKKLANMTLLEYWAADCVNSWSIEHPTVRTADWLNSRLSEQLIYWTADWLNSLLSEQHLFDQASYLDSWLVVFLLQVVPNFGERWQAAPTGLELAAAGHAVTATLQKHQLRNGLSTKKSNKIRDYYSFYFASFFFSLST